MLAAVKRLFGRSAPPAYVETRLERLASYPPPPPPPPVDLPSAAPIRPPAAATRQQVKLIMADGSETGLPADPELTARAEYLVKSMLPPRPPAPGEGSPEQRPV